MRLSYRKKTHPKRIARAKNKVRIRKKVWGTSERPRLSVYRSARHMYAQLVDDVTGKTLAAASTVEKDLGGDGQKKKEAAHAVGQALAKKALAKNIKAVVFDRSGYVYHGRVQAVAEGAREGGLNF